MTLSKEPRIVVRFMEIKKGLRMEQCDVCKRTLQLDDLTYSNEINGEGEEYCSYKLTCTCGHTVLEGNEWGHCEEKEDLMEAVYFKHFLD